MYPSFKNNSQAKTFQALKTGLSSIGYHGELLQEGYRFRDWFSPADVARTAPAAAFGRTPVSYDNACAAVLLANGASGPALIADYRALGAPLAFEVHDHHVLEWRVSQKPSIQDLRSTIPVEAIERTFEAKKDTWSPDALLRAKNIGPTVSVQLDFCDLGLIPALEDTIRSKLDPLLRNVLASAKKDYQNDKKAAPDPRALFRLAVWSLAGKVFHDRGVAPFSHFTESTAADEVLDAVAAHYHEPVRPLLLKQTRQLVHNQIWTKLDFSNISVDVLAHVWLKTFVTQDIRKKLGIHQTPRSIARYIVERLPIEEALKANRPIVEPCCGSATFLIAALHRLRDFLPTSYSAEERHAATKQMLVGYETDAFAVEISRLSLTLADFPNPNGWRLSEADVFASKEFDRAISQTGIVVCNPPYGDFTEEERSRYAAKSTHKPAELIQRILSELPLNSSLGLVLPWQFADGKAYKDIRAEIVERWESVDIVTLPDVAFETADQSTLLLIASEPKLARSDTARLSQRRVSPQEWRSFEARQYQGRVDETPITSTAASSFLGVLEFAQLRRTLQALPALGSYAEIHRGIEWNKPLRKEGKETGWRPRLVVDQPKDKFLEGFPPQCHVEQFQQPKTKYLSFEEEHRLWEAFERPWHKPKVFVNAVRKSRGRWPLAAFADARGLVCYQNLTAVWPRNQDHLYLIEAVLNGPIANAYVATAEDKRHARIATISSIPMPRIDLIDLPKLKVVIDEYKRHTVDATDDHAMATMLLREIDATILPGYDLQPPVEIDLLRWFDGFHRSVPIDFGDYLPTYADDITLREFVDIKLHWSQTNDRRLSLIELELEDTISDEQRTELERLQHLTDVKFRPDQQATIARLNELLERHK